MSELTIQQLAEQIQKDFLGGRGRITQLPGEAHPSVRKFYKYHKGYDYGVPTNTPVTPSFSGIAKDVGVVPGYGRRIVVTNPQTNKSYYLSHLSGINFKTPTFNFQAGQPIAYTGGVPGSYGAGNSTGAHIDIEVAGDQPLYQKLISSGRSVNPVSRLSGLIQQKYGKGINPATKTKLLSMVDSVRKRMTAS